MPALTYRPSIDGLRAVAVLSVFVFHLNHDWLHGGFVGVDVFFVISGYLITSVLQNDFASGNAGLGAFYQRRIARLFPAFFAVALATVLGASLVFSAQEVASTGANLVAAALSLTNVKLMFLEGYFESSPDSQPFLHYWSLSVEEQFYLVFPALLLLLRGSTKRLRVTVLAGLGILSLTASLVLTWSAPTWAFYLLPTRAWELAAGAVLAVALQGSPAPRLPSWLPALGLTGILISFFLIDGDSGFPGYQVLLPVAGTLCLLWPVRAGATGAATGMERLLSHDLLVALGRRSYSLYLWHWPVFCLVDHGLFLWPAPGRLALKVGLSAVLTLVSYKYLETPARVGLRRPERRKTAYVFLAACVALSVGLGYSIRRSSSSVRSSR